MANGYLFIQAYLAGQSLPLRNAKVEIYSQNGEERTLIYTEYTDVEGKTTKIPVETPDISYSEYPNPSEVPFSLFDIFVSAPSFYSVAVKDAQAFENVTSIQYVNMIPLPEGVQVGEKIIVVTPQNL